MSSIREDLDSLPADSVLHAPIIRRGGPGRAFVLTSKAGKVLARRTGGASYGCFTLPFGLLFAVMGSYLFVALLGKNGMAPIEEVMTHPVSLVIFGLSVTIGSGVLGYIAHERLATRITFDKSSDEVSVRFCGKTDVLRFRDLVAVQICSAPSALELDLVSQSAENGFRRYPILADTRMAILQEAAETLAGRFDLFVVDDSKEVRLVK